MNLQNKVALVTGGTKGIGAATAIAFAKAGADVAIVGRNDDADAATTKKEIEALGRRCEVIVADCAKPADAKRCVEETANKLGALDVLVHSAGGPFLKWVVRDAHCTEMKKTLLTCLAWMVVLTSPAQTQ
jgi:NAD(P)-dependent dehydrogenase (short-subunit alcohol dehydrogenase family)